ncbi:MAG: hypothetical protein A2X47_04420 [Lentisphaerae bacterium GWF2_38_69]|nr:MAG: hypothetical protein A2X47_04420 [Lentisphaerae bacterium GWF2_38_69]
MERILNGTIEFRNSDFQAHKELFKELGNKQNPHTKKWLELAQTAKRKSLKSFLTEMISPQENG